MPARSAVGQLPEEIRDELNRRLVDNGFADYSGLAAWLAEQGYKVSRSAVHRHGSELEAEFDQAMADVRRTRALARACKDDGDGDQGDVLSATSGILQEQLLRIAIALRQADTDPAEAAKSISVVARAHADVGRMQVALQKWQEQMREKAGLAADAVEKVARRGGLTAESVDLIRREILGITG
jgi:hypothetical protein